MALSSRFERYLQHFGATIPLREFVERPSTPDMLALRHDVDYDLDIALELAFWERRRGCRASYFILHHAEYWDDPQLLDKCLQIQDFGHEIGLHLNLLTQWYRGEIQDVAGALQALLDKFRSAGIKVNGVAAHGDALCYKAGFTNYWPFEELRPGDPRVDERQVTAEGTRAHGVDHAICYPDSGDQLVRPDGAAFDYWSLRLRDFGLTYEGSRVGAEQYFSDSGGAWKRSPNPLSANLSRGRNVVLMHPLYWRDRQRHYYFLSTARSGSKWLAHFLDAATSVTARHEFTLNHTLEGDKLRAEKRTGAGFTDLLKAPDEITRLINEARGWSESLLTDYAEANIYLERCLDRLPHDQDTIYIHLHRDPKDVVRSLRQRDWYQVPFDDRHPAVDVPDWDRMTQLEQICWYVRDTNERLAEHCTHSLAFERMVSDPEYLSARLEEIGIVVYPRLAQRAFGERVNFTAIWDTPPLEKWPASEQRVFASICGPVSARFGYANNILARDSASAKPAPQIAKRRDTQLPAVELLSNIQELRELGAVSVRNCTLVRNEAPTVRFADRSGHLLLGGGYWHGVKDMPLDRPPNAGTARFEHPPLGGWWTSPGAIHTVGVAIDFEAKQDSLRLFCLSYDKDFNLLGQKELGMLDGSTSGMRRHFRASRQATSFNLALHKAADTAAFTARLVDFKLAAHFENRSAAITPEQALEVAQPRPDAEAGTRRDHRALITSLEAFAARLGRLCFGEVRPWNVTLRVENDRLVIALAQPSRMAGWWLPWRNRTGHLLFGGGTWRAANRSPKAGSTVGEACVWTVTPGDRLMGYVRARPRRDQDVADLTLLTYDAAGKLAQAIRLGKLSKAGETMSFDCVMPPNAHFCNVALVMPSHCEPFMLDAVEIATSSQVRDS